MHCGPSNRNFGRAMAHAAVPPCFPDHMKFLEFSSRGKPRLPGVKCLPIWSTVVLSY